MAVGLRVDDDLQQPRAKEFGFVLFLAIILDATVMRLVIVPAIMVLMKKYNWWMPFVKEPKREVLVTEMVKK